METTNSNVAQSLCVDVDLVKSNDHSGDIIEPEFRKVDAFSLKNSYRFIQSLLEKVFNLLLT